MTAFADRLCDAVARAGAPLCVGLDPLPEHIPALFGVEGSLAAVQGFCEAIIEIAAPASACIKPQLAFFEALGPDGYALAHAATEQARARGAVVLLDAKRGDIGSTAQAYAQACLGASPGFDADAVTVNPYLGWDSLEPFVALAEARAKGVIVLARTSNPGASDLQNLNGDEPVWLQVARMIAPHTHRLAGASGWSGLMMVAGATWPHEARALRAAAPSALLLVPGYGAQGASAEDAVAGFVARDRVLQGGVVSSSRAVLYPPDARQARTLTDWRAAIAHAIAKAKAELAQACRA